MTALAELKRMPSTKGEIASFVASAKNEILSGYGNPLDFDIQLKAIDETIKAIRKDEEIKATIVKELEKYPDKTILFKGVQFTKKQSVKYDYSDDSRWNELNKKMEAIKDEMKAHEELLKSLKAPLFNAETGEEYTPPIRKAEDTYSITFK